MSAQAWAVAWLVLTGPVFWTVVGLTCLWAFDNLWWPLVCLGIAVVSFQAGRYAGVW